MITAQLATVPGREQSVRLTIKSLLPQVDRLTVTFNNDNFEIMRAFADSVRDLDFSKITVRLADNSRGDAEKFHASEKLTGYVLTCDDDLIYPPDYAETMIKHVDLFQGKAIISLHGRVLRKGRISSYYSPSNRLEAYHCLQEVNGYHHVDSGGTGVMAWNADIVKIYSDWFKEANMADVWVAVNARRLEIPIIVAPHPARWLLIGYEGPGIWDKHFNDDSVQTKVWNDEY